MDRRKLLLLSNGGGQSSLGQAKAKASSGEAVTILVIGDSTGNETTEWVYLFATWLGTQYPASPVTYRLWDDSGLSYPSATTVSAGGASGTIAFYNASVTSTAVSHFDGSKFALAVESIPTPDLVIWSHGHNMISGFNVNVVRGWYAGAFAQMQTARPNTPQAAVIQNPRRDTAVYDTPKDALVRLAQLRPDLTLIDVHSVFIAAGKPSGWYADDIHPNSTGEQLGFLPAMQSAWKRATTRSRVLQTPWMDGSGTNLLVNGDFSDWAGALPASWSAIGSCTATKDVGITFDGAPYSAKIVGAGSGPGLRQSFTAGARTAAKATGKISMTAARYVPAGAVSTVGRARVDITAPSLGGTLTCTIRASTDCRGAWEVVSPGIDIDIPSDMTDVTVTLYHDSAASPDIVETHWAGCMVTAGRVPVWF